MGKQNLCSFIMSWRFKRRKLVAWKSRHRHDRKRLKSEMGRKQCRREQPHSSNWLHRNVELILCSRCNNKRIKKQQSHPRDGLYRAVTAALGLQQISGLCQDRRPSGTLLAPDQTSHSDSRAQIYAGRLLNGCQGSGQFHGTTPSMHKRLMSTGRR